MLFGLNSTTGGTGQTPHNTSKVLNPKEYPKLINRNINHIPKPPIVFIESLFRTLFANQR
jgi:hypothetical protein